MSLAALADLYLDSLRVERALSPHTVAAYGRDLGGFLALADDAGVTTARAVDRGLVSRWTGDLARRGLSPRSAARHLSALRGFVKFLMAEGELEDDPTAEIVRPRPGRRLPRALSAAESLELLGAPQGDSLRARRDRALLAVAYAAGLRVSELTGLTVGDVDRTRGVVSALGKGGKRRLVPLGEVALDALDAYLAARGVDGAALDSDAALFASPRGGALTRQAVWKLVRRAGLGAGVRTHVHPHRLRHSFATHLLQGGADLRSVQTLLGHADVATTEIYTHVTQDQVRRAHRKAHPRA